MNLLRNKVFDLLAADSGLGLGVDGMYPVAPESPQERQFMVTKWQEASPGVGRVAPVILQLWAYDRDGGYGRIGDMLKAARPVLDSLPGQLLDASSAVLAVEWQGSSPDLWDPEYASPTRWESYRIVASGV